MVVVWMTNVVLKEFAELFAIQIRNVVPIRSVTTEFARWAVEPILCVLLNCLVSIIDAKVN